MTSAWISLWVCPTPLGIMIQFGSSWTNWRKWHIFFQCTPSIRLKSTKSCILTESCVCTGYPRQLSLTEEPNSLSDFGSNCKSLGTKLIRSSAYHPQTDGRTKRVNQILEDMLRACAIDCGKNWDKYLSLAEFAYNNSYQSSLKMAPFEALYGRRCRTPLNWSQPGEREIFGPDLVTEAERKVNLTRKSRSCSGQAEELPWQEKKTPLVWSGRVRISESIAHQRSVKVWDQRQVSPSIHWTLWDRGSM